jgi:hypothetical protein
MKRDLKADLEELESLKENDVHFMSIVCFIENNAKKWLEQGVVELERAIKAERLKDMLVKYNKFLVAEVLNERERSEQLESLVRELAEALQLYENWEAKLIMDDSLWQSASGLPFITQEVWDDLVAVQGERNKVLHKAKEVLGDE